MPNITPQIHHFLRFSRHHCQPSPVKDVKVLFKCPTLYKCDTFKGKPRGVRRTTQSTLTKPSGMYGYGSADARSVHQHAKVGLTKPKHSSLALPSIFAGEQATIVLATVWDRHNKRLVATHGLGSAHLHVIVAGVVATIMPVILNPGRTVRRHRNGWRHAME